MLFFKSICKTVRPVEKLLQLRVLTFNNLSCIYKEQRQYENALSSVELALQIEDYLLSKNYVHTHKSIASTYLNKCVILSAIGNHEEALMAGKCSLKNIENYRHAFLDQLKEKD